MLGQWLCSVLHYYVYFYVKDNFHNLNHCRVKNQWNFKKLDTHWYMISCWLFSSSLYQLLPGNSELKIRQSWHFHHRSLSSVKCIYEHRICHGSPIQHWRCSPVSHIIFYFDGIYIAYSFVQVQPFKLHAYCSFSSVITLSISCVTYHIFCL